MIQEKGKRLADKAISSLQRSEVPAEESALLEGFIGDALAATNGMTPEEKLQACTENQLTLICLFALHLSEQNAKQRSWKDVIVRCRREILWLGLGLFFLLYFHPEIAGAFDALSK